MLSEGVVCHKESHGVEREPTSPFEAASQAGGFTAITRPPSSRINLAVGHHETG